MSRLAKEIAVVAKQAFAWINADGYSDKELASTVIGLESIIDAKLKPVSEIFNELVRVAGDLSHYPTYGIDIGAHPVNEMVKNAKYRLAELAPRFEVVLASLEVSPVKYPRVPRHDPADAVRWCVVVEQPDARVHRGLPRAHDHVLIMTGAMSRKIVWRDEFDARVDLVSRWVDGRHAHLRVRGVNDRGSVHRRVLA